MHISPIRAYGNINFKGKRKIESNNESLKKPQVTYQKEAIYKPQHQCNPKYDIKNFVFENGKVDFAQLKAAGMICEDLNKIINNEISDAAIEKYFDEILELKYNVVKQCIELSKYMEGDRKTSDIYEIYTLAKKHAKEGPDILDDITNDIIGNINGQASSTYMCCDEILDSTLYKIYDLTRLD